MKFGHPKQAASSVREEEGLAPHLRNFHVTAHAINLTSATDAPRPPPHAPYSRPNEGPCGAVRRGAARRGGVSIKPLMAHARRLHSLHCRAMAPAPHHASRASGAPPWRWRGRAGQGRAGQGGRDQQAERRGVARRSAEYRRPRRHSPPPSSLPAVLLCAAPSRWLTGSQRQGPCERR